MSCRLCFKYHTIPATKKLPILFLLPGFSKFNFGFYRVFMFYCWNRFSYSLARNAFRVCFIKIIFKIHYLAKYTRQKLSALRHRMKMICMFSSSKCYHAHWNNWDFRCVLFILFYIKTNQNVIKYNCQIRKMVAL